LLLHQLSQLLEMRVVAEEIEVTQGASISSTSSTSCSATCSATCLCGCFEKIYWLVASGFRGGCSSGGGSCWWRGGGGGTSLSLFLLDVVGDALYDDQLATCGRGHLK
jgi:hypothetical protein